ncbi:MAG: sensor histidine kinase [Coriobacteriia bacterium]
MPSPERTRKEELREGVIGLGAHSARKSYYPELRRRLEELEIAQAELCAYQQDLEEQVAARTEELRRSNEGLKHATQAKDQFLTSMSHELRTPLNSIIGFTDIILRGLAGPMTDEQERQLGMVNNAGRHLLALINQILDLAKIESGETAPDLQPFDLGAVMDEVVELMRPQAETKGLAVSAECSLASLFVMSDRGRVMQILLNLAGNAVKFTHSGEVRIEALETDHEIIISVSDTGPGIDPERHADVWEPFHQVAHSDGSKPEGTGLGLSISRELAILLNGSLELDSTPGRGSVFSLHLPSAVAE